MEVVDKKSLFWSYAPEEIKGLLLDGETLLGFATRQKSKMSDFSYLVFPFSKGYEGFLKKFFLDLGLIPEDEYYSDDIRIGRILNPKYIQEHKSVYKNLCSFTVGGNNFSNRLWDVWKKGRNEVFHYFPHNFKRLSFDESLDIIKDIVAVMLYAVEHCDVIDAKTIAADLRSKEQVSSLL